MTGKNKNPLALHYVISEHIALVLEAHSGNISASAKALEVNRRTIQRMLHRKTKTRKYRTGRKIRKRSRG